ncbi:hypothetical protein [Sphingomonas psychrotolerans]|uniref:Uncharacterized protein n=1 Tax=Sphingomonas psychrotolerans TaxID=1327635 RepID=A0A2K8MF57_9SPHN|nr:hypothetical protein [Sphingomonas psychrotolerans]ATY31166.1 hypothetical protein CVN68_03535 [Sphingomonas psychrotolerans]
MKMNPRVALVIGIVLLAVGAFITFGNAPPKADPVSAAACRERFKDQGQEMLDRCDEAAFATAMTAADANQAAASISASNNQEVGGNALGMFLLGIGLVLTLAGGVAWMKQSGDGAGEPRK